MNYIDDVALAIYVKAHGSDDLPDNNEMMLYRMYALLAYTLQDAVTNMDVHDAWSAWRSGTNPLHQSIVPFEQLSPEIQNLDSKYRDAILAVIEERGGLV